MCCRLWNKETFWRDWGKKKANLGVYGITWPRGPGICLPRGDPLACDTHVVSYPNITKHGGFYWKHKQIGISAHLSRTRNILVEVFRDMFFRFMHAFLRLIKTKLTLRNRELSKYVNRRFLIESNFF